jgi:predicted DNA binding CopG/RHH family protein
MQNRRNKLISIRVDDSLMILTKELARQHQMRYQTVIRFWIDEWLRRAIQEGTEPSPVIPRT